jgi:hypothetical protein
MLKEGVKIYFDFPESLENRVWLSNGTELTKEINSVGYPYNDLAIIPTKPWRIPSKNECKILFTDHKPNVNIFSDYVGVTKLPQPLINQLLSLGITELKSKESVLEYYKTQEYTKSFTLLSRYITNYSAFSHEISYYNYFVDHPNLDVVTINYNKERIGLHIDNRDQLSVYDAQKGTGIFLINLSNEDRYFLFINQSASNIIHWIEEKENRKIPQEYTVEYINKDFSDSFPNYSVVKLKIKPFEAYIAPAENIIHDGCTEGAISPSLKFAAGGYFIL